MRHRLPIALPLLLVVTYSGAALAGIRFDQQMMVMPDGSGKITFNLALHIDALAMLFKDREFEKRINRQLRPEQIQKAFVEFVGENMQGFHAHSLPEISRKDGWLYAKFDSYFTNLNQVRLVVDSDAAKSVSFDWIKENGDFVLEVKNPPVAILARQTRAVLELAQDVPVDTVKRLSSGFHVSEVYSLPGQVAASPELATKKGRVVSFTINEESLSDTTSLKTWASAQSRKFVVRGTSISDEDVAAFQVKRREAETEWLKAKRNIAAVKESDK